MTSANPIGFCRGQLEAYRKRLTDFGHSARRARVLRNSRIAALRVPSVYRPGHCPRRSRSACSRSRPFSGTISRAAKRRPMAAKASNSGGSKCDPPWGCRLSRPPRHRDFDRTCCGRSPGALDLARRSYGPLGTERSLSRSPHPVFPPKKVCACGGRSGWICRLRSRFLRSVVLGRLLVVISAEGAVAPATGFGGRSEDGCLDPLMKISVLVRRTVVAKNGLCESKRLDNCSAAYGAVMRRAQRLGPALDARPITPARPPRRRRRPPIRSML
jgi:hypothetical protein